MKNRLKELRKSLNLSQAELARTLEISRQSVHGFESGKFTPSLEMAFKIASVLNMPIEKIFLYQEKTIMQSMLDRVEGLTQWFPKGEKFTYKTIEAINYAKQQAALSNKAQVEPEHLLYGLLNHPTTNAARLLRENGLTLELENFLDLDSEIPIVNKFSVESKYVLETALHITRLRQKKYIETEHLLYGLIQLIQLEDNSAKDLFIQYEVNTELLIKKLTEAI